MMLIFIDLYLIIFKYSQFDMNRQDNTQINSRLVSSVQKRQIMWNIIEPGDPYDIRKSMIARLPGRKNFMGDHLELVCLLQAAEIERLCEYLQQYKLKFRQIQRKDLDRHSYQVQIKQLTMQLSQDANSKNQNVKLKEFLRKQTAQYEELRKKMAGGSYEGELVKKYEDSLRQIELLMKENDYLKNNSNQNKLWEYQQIINSKNIQIDQLQKKLLELSSSRNYESQRNQAYYKLQIQFKKLEFDNKRIKEIIEAKNKQIEEFQNKSKQLVYQIEEYSTQIKQFSNTKSTLRQYESRFALMGQQIDRLNLVMREKTNELNDIYNKFRMVEQENKRKNEYINELENKKSQLQDSYRQLDRKMFDQMKDLNVLDQSRTLVKTYESNLQKLSHQIERLNLVLRKKITELDQANRKISQYDYQIRKNQGIRRQIEDFRIEYGQINKKIVDYQSKIAFYGQQIQRLTQQLKRKSDQYDNCEQELRRRVGEIEIFNKKIYDIEIEYKSKISQITRNYQTNVSRLNQQIQINRTKLTASQNETETTKEKLLTSQIQKLKEAISAKDSQMTRYERELKNQWQLEKKRIYEQYQPQLLNIQSLYQKSRQTISEYERRLIMLSEQNQRLKELLKKPVIPSPNKQKIDQEAILRQAAEYQNKLNILSQEIERLNDILRNKINQNKGLQFKINNYQVQLQRIQRETVDNKDYTVNELQKRNAQCLREIQRLTDELRITQQQLNRKNSDHQITSNMSRENQLKIKQLYQENLLINRKNNQKDHQISNMSLQIERLNNVLKIKIDQVGNMEQRYRTSSKENDELRSKLGQLQNKIVILSQEGERLKEILEQHRDHKGTLEVKNKSIETQIQSYRRRITETQNVLRQNQGKYRNIEQQLRSSFQEMEVLRNNLNQAQRKFTQYENKIVILSQQIQRLNEILQKMNRENIQFKRRIGQSQQLKSAISSLQDNLSRASRQNQDLRRTINQNHMTKTKVNQDLQGKMRGLAQQNQEYYRKIQELESRIVYLDKQVQHLNTVLKGKMQDVGNYDLKLRNFYQQNQNLNKRIQELTVNNRKINDYQSKIALLSQQIERLNGILKNKLEENNALDSRCRSYEHQIMNYQRKINDIENNVADNLQTKNNYLAKQNQDLKQRLKQLNSQVNRISELQNKLAILLHEVERLNGNLKIKTEELLALQNKNRAFQQEIQKYKRRSQQIQNTLHRQLKNQSSVFEQRINSLSEENQQFRRQYRDLSDHSRKIPEYQNTIALMSSEIERLNQILLKYNKEIVPSLEEKLKLFNSQNQQYRRRVGQLSEVSKSHQELLLKLKNSLQDNDQYSRRLQDSEIALNQISQEVDRLNGIIRTKTEQYLLLENKSRQMFQELEQANKKLRETTETSRRVPEYQSKIALLSQQIERLNNLLRIKLEQLNSAESKLRMYDHQYETIQRKYSESEGFMNEQKNNRVILEQKITSLVTQNEELRKAFREMSDSNRRIVDYQSRIALLSQQVERLTGHLRMKNEELNSNEVLLQNYKKQAEVKYSNANNELQEFKKKAGDTVNVQAGRIVEYQNKLKIMSQQIERLNYNLKESSYEIDSIQKKETQYLNEIERLNNTLRLKVQETTRWEQANNELKSKLRSYDQNFTSTNSSYQKLNYAHSVLTEQYNKANKHLAEYEKSINKLYLQFERLQQIIQDQKKEIYELKLKLQESGNLITKNRMLSAQIQRLNALVASQKGELDQLRLNLTDQANLQNRIKSDMAMMVMLFAEIESLRNRVKSTENQIQQIRRSSLAPFQM